MDQTVRTHITHLEHLIQRLNEQLMEQRQDLLERNRTELEIRAAEMALDYYRKAIELEKKIG